MQRIKVGPDGAPETIDLTPEEIAARQPTLEQRRSDLIERIRSQRHEVETGGVVVAGIPIRTDEKSQAKITGAVALFDKDPTLTHIDWEAQPGVWVQIDKATAEGLGVAVGRHVQACFSRAKALTAAAIAAADESALALVEADIGQGWPG